MDKKDFSLLGGGATSLYNNTIYNNSDSGVYNAFGTVDAQNNIVNANGIGMYNNSGTYTTADYNLVFGNTTQYSGLSAGAHDVTTSSPAFVNAAGADFHLTASSPAIGAGATLASVTTDMTGVARPQGANYDIGAYEYYAVTVSMTGTPTTPGTNSTPTFSGTASSAAGGTISSITYSIDSGSWISTGVTGTSTWSITTSALADGSHTIRVRATDSYGSTTDSSLYATDTFVIDTTAPTVPGTPTSSSTNTTPTWTWTASTDTGGTGLAAVPYTVEWCSNSSFTGCSSNTDTSTTASYTHTTALTGGTWYLRVNAKDVVGNTSAYSSTGSMTVDNVGPLPAQIIYPTGYTRTGTRPSIAFRKTTDAVSAMKSYSVYLDNGKNRSYSVTGIPSAGNGTSDYIWRDTSEVSVHFLNEGDSDLGNDQIVVYFKGLDTNELTQGKHTVSITAYDALDNPTTTSGDFYIDQTSPSISGLAISNVSVISGGGVYSLSSTNRMPYFSGRVADPFAGSTQTYSNGTKDTFDSVSSKPTILTLSFSKYKGSGEKTDPNSYTSYLTHDFNINDVVASATETFSAFYIQTPYPLLDGYYQVRLTVKDGAGNTYDTPFFYISLNYQAGDGGLIGVVSNVLAPKLEIKVVEEETEKIPTENQEEEKQVAETGYKLQIKVVDTANKPVAHAKVTIHSKVQTTMTDESGIANFTNVEKGKHEILIAYNSMEGEQDIELTGDTVKEFHYTIQITENRSPLLIVIGMLGLIILVLLFLILKQKRK